MHILIAGGAGFIGSHLTDALIKNNHTITGVDNFLTSSPSNIAHLKNNPQFHFIKQDITKPFDIPELIDVIFHLASPASPNRHSPISYHALPMETMMVNTQGTLRLLELANKKKARFLFASTSEIYGDPLVHPQTEEYRGNTSTTGPRSVYDEAKRFGETLTAFFHRQYNLDTRIVRIFNTYGPRMHPDDMRMVVIFIQKALKNEPIPIFGDGSQTRSVSYVTDTVDGLIRFMMADHLAGEIINIGNPEEHTVLEYAQIIKKLCHSKSEIKITETLPIDDPKKRKPDITKAKKLLGWEPSTSLEDGLMTMIISLRGNI